MTKQEQETVETKVSTTEPCCKNCKLRFELRKSDYSKGGCEHTTMSGFVCMAFANEGIAEWMCGISEEGMCECFTQKEVKYEHY